MDIVKKNIFESGRLRLRPFLESDINQHYIDWLNDPEVVRYSNQRFSTHSIASSQGYLQSFIGTNNLFLAIEEKFSGNIVGTLTIYNNSNHQTADVGIMVGDKTVWGYGYGKEAFLTVVDVLLNTYGVRKVTAGTLSSNVAMVKIMIGAGLTLEATRKSQELLDGHPVDVVYYARFKDA